MRTENVTNPSHGGGLMNFLADSTDFELTENKLSNIWHSSVIVLL